jgi:hypothetical protein
VEPGKFEEKANKMRMQERLAQLSAEINETAKKTGISSTVKLAVLTVKVSSVSRARQAAFRAFFLFTGSHGRFQGSK